MPLTVSEMSLALSISLPIFRYQLLRKDAVEREPPGDLDSGFYARPPHSQVAVRREWWDEEGRLLRHRRCRGCTLEQQIRFVITEMTWSLYQQWDCVWLANQEKYEAEGKYRHIADQLFIVLASERMCWWAPVRICHIRDHQNLRVLISHRD